MPNYLVESYLPQASLALESASDHARDAADFARGKGLGVRYVRTTFLETDETCFHVFDADSLGELEAALDKMQLNEATGQEATNCRAARFELAERVGVEDVEARLVHLEERRADVADSEALPVGELGRPAGVFGCTFEGGIRLRQVRLDQVVGHGSTLSARPYVPKGGYPYTFEAVSTVSRARIRAGAPARDSALSPLRQIGPQAPFASGRRACGRHGSAHPRPCGR